MLVHTSNIWVTYGYKRVTQIHTSNIPATFDSPHFLLALFWNFNMALSQAKTFARPKRTPALQAMFCLNPSATSLPADVLWGSFVTHSLRDKRTSKDVCDHARRLIRNTKKLVPKFQYRKHSFLFIYYFLIAIC